MLQFLAQDAAPADLMARSGCRRLRDGAQSPVTAGARRLAGRDPNQAIRAALREAKQLLETGEVLHPDSPPTTQTTAVNKPLQMATRQGRREGRL